VLVLPSAAIIAQAAMVMEDVRSAPGNIRYRRQFGEIDDAKKAMEEPTSWRITKLVETVMKSILFFIVALLPMVMSYVPPPESVLRMKELMAEWCTPSICFVFLVVGILVATSGVLNGAQSSSSSRGLYDRGDVHQRHVTVVQREAALRMPDIFSVGESVRPLSIPTPAPVPSFPVRDFPAVRPFPVYLKRDVSSRFENELRRGGLGKSISSPSRRLEALIPAAKISATLSMEREAYFTRPHEPLSNGSNNNISFQQIPVMSSSNSFRDRLAARRAPPFVAVPAFEHEYPPASSSSLAPPAYSVTTSSAAAPAVSPLEIPASPSPRPTSARSFEAPPRTPSPTSTTHVIDHDLLASPTMPHSDVVTLPPPSSPSLAPAFVREMHSISNMRPPTPASTRPATPSTRPATPASTRPSTPASTRPSTPAPPCTPPVASPVAAVHESVVIRSPLALPLRSSSPPDSPVDDEGPESPVPESPVEDSPPATPTASPPPPPPDSPPATPIAWPPPPPPLLTPSTQDSPLDANVIAPVEVNLSPIVTRKPHSVRTNRSLKQSSGRKPPSHPDSHHTGEPMSVPAKGSTSAAQKYEGESYLAMKAAAAGNQSRNGELVVGKVMTDSMLSATSSPSVAAESAVNEETDSKPAEDDVNQRVEAFLANFRQQIRLQRQESLQRHHRGEE
jgi:hypothetical protein